MLIDARDARHSASRPARRDRYESRRRSQRISLRLRLCRGSRTAYAKSQLLRRESQFERADKNAARAALAFLCQSLTRRAPAPVLGRPREGKPEPRLSVAVVARRGSAGRRHRRTWRRSQTAGGFRMAYARYRGRSRRSQILAGGRAAKIQRNQGVVRRTDHSRPWPQRSVDRQDAFAHLRRRSRKRIRHDDFCRQARHRGSRTRTRRLEFDREHACGDSTRPRSRARGEALRSDRDRESPR